MSSDNLYTQIANILKEDGTIFGLLEYLKENKIFEEWCTGEMYDAAHYEIPLEDWILKTGMSDEHPQLSIRALDKLITEPYQGAIALDCDIIYIHGSA